jgi:hypothetical protein
VRALNTMNQINPGNGASITSGLAGQRTDLDRLLSHRAAALDSELAQCVSGATQSNYIPIPSLKSVVLSDGVRVTFRTLKSLSELELV